jgi:hypothetical protein
MAINRSTQAALTIALSIFVMLTFALGITTYLYFNKAQEAEQGLATATAEAANAENNARQTAEQMNELREVVGVQPDTPVAEVRSQLENRIAGQFAGFPVEDATYLKLLEWVRTEFEKKSTAVKTADEEKKALAAQKAAELAGAEKAKAAALKAEQDAKDASAAAAADFAQRRSGVERERDDLLAKKQAAEQESNALRSLKAEVAKGLDFMPPSRKGAFQTEIEADNPIKQLDLMRLELRSRAKTIQELNDILARLRVADPRLQQEIIAARPADDRIDGFNGHIVSVDPRLGTALISCRTTAGLRPGLVLHVFTPDDPQPEFGTSKAVVEITEVEGPTLLRAAIRRQKNSRDPILSGDGVSSSLWAGGVTPEIVVVGFADVDSDGRSDRDLMAAIIEEGGGRIVDAVAPNTALVVDLGQPSAGEAGREVPGWPAESKRRSRSLDDAKAYNIRVTGLPGLLDMLGLDAESFRPGRLPKPQAVGRLPGR